MGIEVDTVVAVSGECMCHGVHVEGPLNLVSRPRQPYWHQDLFKGRTACWWVKTDSGSHDVAMADATVTYKSELVGGPEAPALAVRYCEDPNCTRCKG